MHKKLKTKRGVTLVELMVVIVLIGILAAIASPGISKAIERQNAREVASGVANALRTARNQAMSRGTPLWAKVSPGSAADDRGSIVVSRQGASATDAARSCREFNSAAQFEVFRYEPAGISGKSAIRGVQPFENLCFSPDGRVLNETGGLLSLTPSPDACSGEDAFIYTADYDATVASTHLACPADETERPGLRDSRALIHMYKISVPYNGAIAVEQ